MSVKMTKQHIFIIENNLQKVGQSFFHLSRLTTVIQDLLVRRQFSLVPDNRTNVNVEAWVVIKSEQSKVFDVSEWEEGVLGEPAKSWRQYMMILKNLSELNWLNFSY
jgi:hypothetical protein